MAAETTAKAGEVKRRAERLDRQRQDMEEAERERQEIIVKEYAERETQQQHQSQMEKTAPIHGTEPPSATSSHGVSPPRTAARGVSPANKSASRARTGSPSAAGQDPVATGSTGGETERASGLYYGAALLLAPVLLYLYIQRKLQESREADLLALELERQRVGALQEANTNDTTLTPPEEPNPEALDAKS